MARSPGPSLARPGGWRWVLKWALLLVLAVLLVLAIVYSDAARAAGSGPWATASSPASPDTRDRWKASDDL